MNTQLAVKPIQIAGESPAGVLIRAVEENGYKDLQSLIWAYWENKGGQGWAKAAFTDPSRFSQMVNAFGISVPENELACFTRTGPTSESDREIEGSTYPEKLFRDDARYYCPICLLEHRYWRKVWTLRPFSVCPQHNIYLVEDCTVCGARLDPCRGKLDQCACGAQLTQAKCKQADPATLLWWLEYRYQSAENSHLADELYLALVKLDEGSFDPKIENWRIGVVRSWLENRTLDPTLPALINKCASTTHPRIQILPLLDCALPENQAMASTLIKRLIMPTSLSPTEDDNSMRCQDAQLALGITYAQFKHFTRHKLLDFKDGRKLKRGQVSFNAVNQLLFRLQGDSHDASHIKSRAPTCSLAEVISGILSGEHNSAGYDISTGLNSLRFYPNGVLDAQYDHSEADWLDITQIAERIGSYPEAVRSLIKRGWIPGEIRLIRGSQRFVALNSSVEDFNQRYLLAGTFATQILENPRNIAEKLMTFGIAASAGPKIDGSLVYLFKRADLEQVDIPALKALKDYTTNTGRPKKTTVAHDDGQTLSAVAAAEMLNVRVHDIHILLRKQFLKNAVRLDRAIYVETQSLLDFKNELHRQDMISVEDAASRLKLSARVFEGLWVIAGVLKVQDLGLWRRVAIHELEDLEQTLTEYATAAEAGEILSMHRSHLPNLERRGAIQSIKVGTKRTVRLYLRTDIEKLRNKTDGQPTRPALPL